MEMEMEAGRKHGEGSAPNKLCASPLCVHAPSPVLKTHSALYRDMLILLFPLSMSTVSFKVFVEDDLSRMSQHLHLRLLASL